MFMFLGKPAGLYVVKLNGGKFIQYSGTHASFMIPFSHVLQTGRVYFCIFRFVSSGNTTMDDARRAAARYAVDSFVRVRLTFRSS